jgi:ATP-binding cassette subfamily B protein RaxB
MGILQEINLSGRRKLPVVLAAEAVECGLACLTMVGRYHGHDIDLNGLRQRFALSMSGASLRSLMGIADQLGLTTRALRVELDALARIKTPAILHWDLNHFVVLAKVERRRLVIHDPGLGKRRLSFDEASKHMTGVVLELAPARGFAPVTENQPTKLSHLWSKLVGICKVEVRTNAF